MKEKFAVSFYRWSQTYAKTEVDSDFPFLRQFENPGVFLFLQLMDTLDAHGRHVLAKGLLKRYHVYASEILNEPADPEEANLVHWYLYKGKRAFETGEWLRLKPNVSGNRLDRRTLRERIISFMGNDLGQRVKYVPGWMRFDATISGRTVSTLIALRGPGADLSYIHEVLDPDGTRIAFCISAESWLGLTGGPTQWERVCEGNIQQVLKALRNGCVEFLSAVPSFF